MKELIFCTNLRPLGGQPSCGGRGSVELASAVKDWIDERGLDLQVDYSVCLGHCHEGPNVRIAPGGDFIHEATLEKIIKVLEKLEME
jgi:NADH:ubiquinone oxidoreductase subunit E